MVRRPEGRESEMSENPQTQGSGNVDDEPVDETPLTEADLDEISGGVTYITYDALRADYIPGGPDHDMTPQEANPYTRPAPRR